MTCSHASKKIDPAKSRQHLYNDRRGRRGFLATDTGHSSESDAVATAAPNATDLDRGENKMKKIVTLCVIVLAFALVAAAQDVSRMETFLGYT